MENESWLELAIGACEHAGLKYDSIEILVTWEQKNRENALYRLDGQRILKIYGPPVEWRFQTEYAVLQILDEHQIIPNPCVIAAGERSGEPPYVFMTTVAGLEMANAWNNMEQNEQLTIARKLGTIMAAIYHLSPEEITDANQQYNSRNEYSIKVKEARRTAEIIKTTEILSIQQRNDLLRFLYEEAPEHLKAPPKIIHFDLSHHHVYLSQETGTWQVTGIIDWADSVAGPLEWDIVCLWHWTFNGVWHHTFTVEWEAMQACLQTLFDGHPPPERFARRCLAAYLQSPWMSLIWPYFLEQKRSSHDIVRDLTKYLFTPHVFGSPD
jgi:Ser/Thr protein kinase RdoA (MazF antagonist)